MGTIRARARMPLHGCEQGQCCIRAAMRYGNTESEKSSLVRLLSCTCGGLSRKRYLMATEQTTAEGTLWFHAQSPSKKPRAERIGLKASSPSSESEPSFSSLIASSSSSLSGSSFRSAASASGTSLEHPGSDFC